MKLVLASTNKFKSDIMDKVCMKHSLCESDYLEHEIDSSDVYSYVKMQSLGKANSIKDKIDSGIILGLDTVSYLDGIIMEKPKDLEEAKNNLRLSSNKTSNVITGITLINKDTNEVVTTYAESFITFNNISEEDIDYYIENEPDVLYASGFILETVASNFLNKIEGSYYNILGVPVEKIYEELLKWGIHLKDLE